MRIRMAVGTALTAASRGVLAASGAAPAMAISGAISPSTQSHPKGVASTWGTGWGTVGPYNQYFCYGNGSSCPTLTGTTATSRGYSYDFFPCYTETFTQTLYVEDHYSTTEYLHSTATEGGSQPC